MFLHGCLRNNVSVNKWLVLSGKTGCGKTHLANRVHCYYDAHKVTAWAQGWWGGSSHISAPVYALWPTMCDFADQSFSDWMSWEVSGSRLVILDDVGGESERFKNGANESRLLTVLEACKAKWLLVTTNLAPADWPKRYDQRVTDRLLAARVVNMHDVPSYRIGGGR